VVLLCTSPFSCEEISHLTPPPSSLSSSPQVCKYLDMPLQHINNLTLLAMNRPPQGHTLELLQRLRRDIPGLALRTTFISGGGAGRGGGDCWGARRGGVRGPRQGFTGPWPTLRVVFSPAHKLRAQCCLCYAALQVVVGPGLPHS
jgi:hypothetical protein